MGKTLPPKVVEKTTRFNNDHGGLNTCSLFPFLFFYFSCDNPLTKFKSKVSEKKLEKGQGEEERKRKKNKEKGKGER